MKSLTSKSIFFAPFLLALFPVACSGKHTVEVPEYQDSSISSWLCDRFVCSNIVDAGPDTGMDLGVDLPQDQGLDLPIPDLPSPDIVDPDGFALDLLVPDEGVLLDTSDPDSEPQGCIWSVEPTGSNIAIMEPKGIATYATPQPNMLEFVLKNMGEDVVCEIFPVPQSEFQNNIEILDSNQNPIADDLSIVPTGETTFFVKFKESAFENLKIGEHEFAVEFWIKGAKDPNTTQSVLVHVYNPGSFLWTRSETNPVMGPDPYPASWEGFGVFPGAVIKNPDQIYEMWYVGVDQSFANPKVGYASSTDGISWTRLGVPVAGLDADPGAWDDGFVLPSCVLLDDDGTYRMYYHTFYSQEYGPGGIGLATSLDGITWTKVSPDPIWEPVFPGGDKYSVESVSVVKSETGFEMWIASGTYTESLVHYLTSTNGESWDLHPSSPIITLPYDKTRCTQFEADVIKDQNGYRMFLLMQRDEDLLVKDYENIPLGIFVLFSEDGINWSSLDSEKPLLDVFTHKDWKSNLWYFSVLREDPWNFKAWYGKDDETGIFIAMAEAKPPGFFQLEIDIDSSVVCTASAESNCKGTLVYGASRGPTSPYLNIGAMTVETNVDLSKGTTLSRQIPYAPEGENYVVAFLSEDNDPHVQRAGDLQAVVMATAQDSPPGSPPVQLSLERIQQDSNSSVWGSVTRDPSAICSTWPGSKCSGVLQVFIAFEPYGNQYALYQIEADFSSAGASVPYELHGLNYLPANMSWYVCAYLRNEFDSSYQAWIATDDLVSECVELSFPNQAPIDLELKYAILGKP